MLERIGDFRYVTVSDISGFLEAGGSLVQPLPKRADASIPFDQASEAEDVFAGDVMLIDPAYLKEACQERETLLTGDSATVDPPDVSVRSSEFIAVANVLKSWASRWESDCPSEVFCKPDVLDEWTEWEELGGATISWSYEDRWSDVALLPSELGQWREFIPEDPDGEDKFDWAKKVKKAFLKHALRDYLSIPKFLGLEADDDLEELTFGWKEAEDWCGYYPPVVKCSDVMLLYSDLERTVCGSIVGLTTEGVDGTYETSTESESTTEYSGNSKSHDDCSDGCGTFRHDDAPAPQHNEYEYSNSGEWTIEVSPGGFCAVGNDIDVTSTSTYGSISGEYENEQETNSLSRGYTNCHDGDCNHTGFGVYDFWTSKRKSLTKNKGSLSADSSVEFDLSDRLENGATVEKASILVFVVATEVEAEKETDTVLLVVGSGSESYPESGTKYSGNGKCKFTVSAKLVECSVSEGVVTVNMPSASGIPSASGGESIELELPDDTGTSPQGSEQSPYTHEEKQKYTGSRKSVVAFGPLFVKFVPKTLIEEA